MSIYLLALNGATSLGLALLHFVLKLPLQVRHLVMNFMIGSNMPKMLCPKSSPR